METGGCYGYQVVSRMILDILYAPLVIAPLVIAHAGIWDHVLRGGGGGGVDFEVYFSEWPECCGGGGGGGLALFHTCKGY